VDVNEKRSVSFIWVYGFVALVAVVLTFMGSHFVGSGEESHSPNTVAVGWGLLGTAGLILASLLVAMPIVMSIDAARKAIQNHEDQILAGLTKQLRDVCTMLNLVNENQLISDRAKSVAFRINDRDAIRRAITEEIARPDWEAALALANDMENLFGYKTEADRYRAEIMSKRQSIVDGQISEQMVVVDRYTNAEAWGQALHEAQRIMALFPDDPKVQQLPQEIDARRAAFKKQLQDSWAEAVQNHDVDGSIETLKHLDQYLTPSEAEAMQETARGVFKEKIALLRVQFTEAAQDHRWAEAIRLGESIISDFPNTRMAQEVRDMMDMLRQRASGGEGAVNV
jgi:hypothetical protein